MIGFGKRTALMLLKPMLQDIIKDILTAGTINSTLAEAKTIVIDSVMKITGETHFTWDDYIAEKVLEFILEGDIIDEVSLRLLQAIEVWVKDSDTKWDDELILPALAQLRIAVEMKESA